MSVYPTPTRSQGSIFNADLWIIEETGAITQEYLEANFLEYPRKYHQKYGDLVNY